MSLAEGQETAVKDVTVSWPDVKFSLLESCKAKLIWKLSFLGANGLPSNWAIVNLDDRELVVKTASLGTLSSDRLVLATVEAAFIDETQETEELQSIASAKLEFAVKIETPKAKEKDKTEDKPEETIVPDEPKEADTSSSMTNSTFEGVMVKKPVKAKTQEKVVLEPIIARVSLVSDRGIIKVAFSRSVIIKFNATQE